MINNALNFLFLLVVLVAAVGFAGTGAAPAMVKTLFFLKAISITAILFFATALVLDHVHHH